jgi:hypothetical protein
VPQEFSTYFRDPTLDEKRKPGGSWSASLYLTSLYIYSINFEVEWERKEENIKG